MVPPCWAIPIGLAFLTLVAVAVSQRPPLTPRGRVSYALTGILGLVSGGVWLLWNAAQAGLVDVDKRGRETWHPELLGNMFGPSGDGTPVSSLVAIAFLLAGVWFIYKAALGPSFNEGVGPGE